MFKVGRVGIGVPVWRKPPTGHAAPCDEELFAQLERRQTDSRGSMTKVPRKIQHIRRRNTIFIVIILIFLIVAGLGGTLYLAVPRSLGCSLHSSICGGAAP
jgi:hypothetical protein